jgi:hypothetical protein
MHSNRGTPAAKREFRLHFVQNLGNSWRDLADDLQIPPFDQNKFGKGEEPREIWVWLQERSRLPDLIDALRRIGREDLAKLLEVAVLSAASPDDNTPPAVPKWKPVRRLVLPGVGALAVILAAVAAANGFERAPSNRPDGASPGPSGVSTTATGSADLRERACSPDGVAVMVRNHHSQKFLFGADRPRLDNSPQPLLIHASTGGSSPGVDAPGCAVSIHSAPSRQAVCMTREGRDGADVRWAPCGGGNGQVWLLQLVWIESERARWMHLHPVDKPDACLAPVKDDGPGTDLTLRSCTEEWVLQWGLEAA